MVQYQIEKPLSDNSYFTLFLKYSTLFIVVWFIGWGILLFYTEKYKIAIIENTILDNGGAVSLAVAISVVIFFARRTYAKYKYGSAFVITFSDNDATCTIRLTNTINGKEWDVTIPYQHLAIFKDVKQNELFGEQNIYAIYNSQKPVTIINIALTAWCRLENIDALTKRLESFNPDKNTLQPV